MRIIITMLTAMSLLLNSSCGNTANTQTDEHSGSESENITTTEILENTSEPQNKNILPITFELCDLPDEPFDMAEADNVQVLMNFEAVVLGRSVKCETTISHKMDDPFTYLYFATCTDADSGEIFLRGYDIDFCDPNGDGSLEVLVSDHLIIEKNGAYMSGFSSTDHNTAIQAFAAGQTAMLYCGSWWSSIAGGTDNGFTLDVIQLPLMEGLRRRLLDRHGQRI